VRRIVSIVSLPAVRRWLLVALIVRLLFVSLLSGERYYFSDARHYDQGAKQILDTGGLTSRYERPPLYAYLLAGVYAITGPSFTAARVADALLSTLLCLLIFVLARHMFAERTARWALALSALYPHFILLCGLIYPTNLFTFLLTAAIAALIMVKPLLPRALLSGVLLATAALAVPAAIFVLPVFLISLAVIPKTAGRKFSAVTLFLLAYALVLTPWTMRNYRLYGRFVWVQFVPNTVLPDFNDLDNRETEVINGFPSTTDYKNHNPHGSEEDRLDRLALRYIKHPVKTLTYALSEMGHFWALYPDRLNTLDHDYRRSAHQADPRMSLNGERMWPLVPLLSSLVMAPIFIFSLVGFWFSRSIRSSSHWIFFGVLAFMTLGYSMITAEVRYRIPVEPCLLVFTALGMQMCWRQLVTQKSRRSEKKSSVPVC